MAEKIRLSNVKKVSVGINDDGETIEFYPDFNTLSMWGNLVGKLENLKEKANSLSDDDITGTTALYDELFSDIYAGINVLFGEDASLKLFKGSKSLAAIMEFMEQISPILQKFCKQENVKLKKYLKGVE